MTQWWALLITVYLSVHLAAAQHHRRALYPSAYRIKRGTYSLVNPTFQRSAEDVNLLFEVNLLAGMQISAKDVLIPDEELASLRAVEKLEVLCEDVLPKRLSDIRRLTAELAQRRQASELQDFERTVLTLVYATQTLARGSGPQQREAWTDAHSSDAQAAGDERVEGLMDEEVKNAVWFDWQPRPDKSFTCSSQVLQSGLLQSELMQSPTMPVASCSRLLQ
ncbi:LOW QUALITY PROTEIN: protein FAM180A [Plectropomus leopardus]|uniref:LOW QUALITY PROTEIN: protein FAM180A n=1 Tax=Plectropomus leopardus TaxID=160734 RepID=UPI001C4A8275|nr:LOW QUALITY PROTEIN: protein FAM180A [Plectropomus leopardus]